MTKLILGLGNPEDKYASTRHNIGFFLIDSLAEDYNLTWTLKAKFKAQLAEFTHKDEKIILAKPQTYYNLVGESARALKDFYKLEDANILAIHDELALPYGTVRTRIGGSDAGNNGIKSLIQHIGQDFARIRVGIANEHTNNRPAEVFVLDNFTSNEAKNFSPLFKEVHELIQNFIDEDHEFSHTTKKLTL